MTSRHARSRLSVAIGLAMLFAAAVGETRAQENTPAVRLSIDYGDGVQKSFAALAWKEKMTVWDALQAAGQHSRGIRVSHTGSGETIFITAIDDQANEGAGGRNWSYTINDKSARYSAGIAEVKSGDAIVWRFGR